MAALTPLPSAVAVGSDRHATVVEVVGAAICGTLPAGSVIVVEEVCATHGVSRSVVREAFRVLESKGLVEARRGVGTTTRPRSGWNLLDPDVVRWRLHSDDRLNQLLELLELRAAFEPEAAALAAERGDLRAVADLVTSAAHLWTLGHGDAPEEFLAADERFHELLLAASGNEMFAQLAPVVGAILRGRAAEGLTPLRPAGHALENHLALARAIQVGNADQARALARQLVRDTLDESRSLWESAGTASG